MSETLQLHTDDNNVAWLRLNRPTVRNAFDAQLIQELDTTLNTLKEETKPRVLVLAAAGEHFSAGADLNWMKKTAEYTQRENQRDALNLARLLTTLNEFPVPTIARVNGSAFGGGVGLISCCDVAIACDNAQFALSEVRLGLIPATISPFVLDAIGIRAARRYFLTGERFDADTALRIGLVHEVVNGQNLDASINTIIDALLLGGPIAQVKAKELIRDVASMQHNRTLERETASRIAQIRATSEGQEGITAFLEKRKAAWCPDSV